MFKNLKVLELATVLAGPSVGQFFAELGADVIKVENALTGGDVTRSWKVAGEETDDRSAYFSSVNWGKRSIMLDLNLEASSSIIHRLVKRSDIVIASYKPGDAEKLRVDYKTLSSLNPSIIYGQITGYGSDNPRVGYDAVVQAEAGFMFMNGEPGRSSLKMPVALIDILAGHHLKESLLLALLHRQQTGQGSFVEVSLIQAAISSLANQATNWLITGKLPQKQGSSHPNIAPYGDVFKTSDSQEIILAIGNDRQFQDLCSMLSTPAIGLSPDFKSNQLRVKNRPLLQEMLQTEIEKFSSQQLMSKMHASKIPAGIIQNLSQVFNMKEAQDVLLKTDLSGIRNFIGHTSFIDAAGIPLLSPPHLGEHTSTILSEITE